jgi:predicted nucleotidyltransferase
MRLTAQEIDAIKTAAAEAFGADAVVRLFGSRVHDHLRGGDIDLLIEVDDPQIDTRTEARFLDRLFERIDEQRVDIVYTGRDHDPAPIVAIARRDGVRL